MYVDTNILSLEHKQAAITDARARAKSQVHSGGDTRLSPRGATSYLMMLTDPEHLEAVSASEVDRLYAVAVAAPPGL